jgi:hypothetical protein
MNGSRGTISLARSQPVFQAPNLSKNLRLRSTVILSEAQRSRRIPLHSLKVFATGFLDFARNDSDDIRGKMKSFWLVKQEPSSYSWSDFLADGETSWTGVRNFSARNNLRKMRTGDEVLFYHSGDEKGVVGIAKVTRTAYPDPTAKEGDWSTVDLAAVKPLNDLLHFARSRAIRS